jgi:CDP-diacylglycerol--serine O-phosphatidyltransferase
MRVPPEMVLPVVVAVVLFIVLLISYPWHILSAVSIMYLLSLPIGWKSYRDQERRLAAEQSSPADATPPTPEPPYAPAAQVPPDDRPSRLN